MNRLLSSYTDPQSDWADVPGHLTDDSDMKHDKSAPALTRGTREGVLSNTEVMERTHCPEARTALLLGPTRRHGYHDMFQYTRLDVERLNSIWL